MACLHFVDSGWQWAARQRPLSAGGRPAPRRCPGGLGFSNGTAGSATSASRPVNGDGETIAAPCFFHMMHISPPRELFCEFQPQTQFAFGSLKKNWLFYHLLQRRVFIVPVRHGDCSRSHRVRFLRLFAEGPHGGEVQRAASGAGRGQNSDGPGGGAAFVSHLSRFRSGGVSWWVVSNSEHPLRSGLHHLSSVWSCRLWEKTEMRWGFFVLPGLHNKCYMTCVCMGVITQWCTEWISQEKRCEWWRRCGFSLHPAAQTHSSTPLLVRMGSSTYWHTLLHAGPL